MGMQIRVSLGLQWVEARLSLDSIPFLAFALTKVVELIEQRTLVVLALKV
jgi:hypothetical protein